MGKYFILAVSVMRDEWVSFLVPAEDEGEARRLAEKRLPEGWVVINATPTLSPMRFTFVQKGEYLGKILPEMLVRDGENQTEAQVGSTQSH